MIEFIVVMLEFYISNEPAYNWLNHNGKYSLLSIKDIISILLYFYRHKIGQLVKDLACHHFVRNDNSEQPFNIFSQCFHCF